VDNGPLYPPNGTGPLDPTVMQWNYLVTGAFADIGLTVPVALGGNTNYVADISGNGRVLTGVGFVTTRRVTVTGTLGIAATGSEDCEFQTLGPTDGAWRTMIVVSAGCVSPGNIGGNYLYELVDAFFEGWSVGDGGNASLLKQYPFGTNPAWSAESDHPHVLIATQNGATPPVLSLWIDGSLLLRGTPANPPANHLYGGGSWSFNASTGGAGGNGFARTLYEAVLMSRVIADNEVAGFTAWFRARANF